VWSPTSSRSAAFVDIGVHQDGLVHVSQLADRYVKDPNDVVKVGQKVKVTVQSIDLARGRIALSMRKDAGTPGAPVARADAGGTRGDVRAHERTQERGSNRTPPKVPAKPSFVPTKGAVAPNGMRFK
jgi:uncharacterized protein